MPADVTYLAAFLIGLTGGVHCVAMCGGIAGALTLGLPDTVRRHPRGMLPYLLAYNAGRVASYTVAGALLGGIGSVALSLVAVHEAQRVLQVLAALFMLALGLYLGGWWRGLARLERLGGHLWRRLEPWARNLLPVRSPWHALQVGLVWGWLPCGLVYSVLAWSIASGGVVSGALMMLCFGLGTLPTLLGLGVFAARLSAALRRPALHRLAGALVLALGGYLAYGALARPLAPGV